MLTIQQMLHSPLMNSPPATGMMAFSRYLASTPVLSSTMFMMTEALVLDSGVPGTAMVAWPGGNFTSCKVMPPGAVNGPTLQVESLFRLHPTATDIKMMESRR